MSNYIDISATVTLGSVKVTSESDVGMAANRRYDAKGNATFVPSALQNRGTRPNDPFTKMTMAPGPAARRRTQNTWATPVTWFHIFAVEPSGAPVNR